MAVLLPGSALKRNLQITEGSGLTGKEPALGDFILGKPESAGLTWRDTPAQQKGLAGAALPLHASAGVVNAGHQGSVQDGLGLAHLDTLTEITNMHFHLERSRP